MNLRVLICGVVGGLLVTLTLSWPLFLFLPTLYAPDWVLGASPEAALAGYVLTPPFLLAMGYCAARWGWAASSGHALATGGFAGFIAAMVAYPLIGAGAGGVLGNAEVYQNGARPAGSDDEAVKIVCQVVADVAWWPYLIFWAFVVCGMAFAALGGWLFARQGQPAWGSVPPLVPEVPVDASIAVIVMAVLQLLVCVAAITSLADNAARSQAEIGFQTWPPTNGILRWPVAMNLLILCVATWFAGRWCARRWDHPVPGVRKVAYLGACVQSGAPILTLGLLLLIRPDIFLDPVFLTGVAAWAVLTLYWYRRIWSATRPLSEHVSLTLPLLRDRLLIGAGLLGVLVPALVLVGGVTPAISLGLGVVTFLADLFGKVPAGRLASPSATLSILWIYVVHFFLALNLVGVWLIFVLVHAGGVLVWQALKPRLPAAPPEELDESSAQPAEAFPA